jgi:alpha-glucosidase
MADFGYDVSDHTDVDPVFGELGDFDQMLAEANRLGLKVLVDFVPNHTSDQHPWFLESRTSRTSPKRDWYYWRDPAPDGGPPNNWLSIWGGSGWEYDPATEQYYYHHFARAQPDLDWRNPEVEAAMFDVARFWLDRGVDGFRIDVADFIAKDPLLRDNPPTDPGGQSFHKSFGAYESQQHIHDRRHPDVHAIYRRFRAMLDTYEPPRVCVGEIHVFDWPVWARHYGENLDEIHLPFNFGLLKAQWSAAEVRGLVEAIEAAVPPGGWPNYVLGNHDEPRLATRIGAKQARLAAMLLLTLRGTPTLYYGDELGMVDGDIPAELMRDPQAETLPGMSRDPCRTPMQWDADPNAGFTDASAIPWLPIGPASSDHNVETALAAPRSILSLYRQLVGLRRKHAALRTGSYRSLPSAPDVYCFERSDGAERWVVVLSFSEEPRDLRGLDGEVVVSTHLDRIGSTDHAPPLRPHEGVLILQKQ